MQRRAASSCFGESSIAGAKLESRKRDAFGGLPLGSE
jgi:hypothetical protein